MRLQKILLIVFLLFTTVNCTNKVFAQNRDTIVFSGDSVHNAVRQSVKEEFQRWKDSVDAVRIKQEVAKNGKPLNEFLQEMQAQEKVQKRQLYFRIGIGALFFIVLAVGFARRWRNR